MPNHRIVGVLAAVVLGAACAAARAQGAPPGAGALSGPGVRVTITRDNWVSSFPGEVEGNNGGDQRLKTKGIVEFALLDFETKDLVGHIITGATLHLHCSSPADPQRRLTVSTLATEWVEGTGTRYLTQNGSSCFNWAARGLQPWAYPGSDLTAACNGMGNTLWRFADATPPTAAGWQTVAVEPDVLGARLAGISHGLVVMDDVGSEYQRSGEKFTYSVFPNRWLASHRSGQNAPYLTVYLGAVDTQPLPAVTGLAQLPGPNTLSGSEAGVPANPGAGEPGGPGGELPPGEVLVRWLTPKKEHGAHVIGFLAHIAEGTNFDWPTAKPVPQYLVPMAPRAGEPVTLHLRDLGLKPGAVYTLGIRAADSAGIISPVVTCAIKTSNAPPVVLAPAPVEPFADDGAAPLPRVGGLDVFVIDPLDKVHPVTGDLIPRHDDKYAKANHLWSARQKLIRLYAARNEFVACQLVLAGSAGEARVQVQWDAQPGGAIQSELWRPRHVSTARGPLPDPLVPCDGKITLPAKDEAIAGQRYAEVLADLYVPHDAAPGLHKGTLTITSGDQKLALAIELHVWDFTLPDYLSFIPEMNCYGLPDPPGELAYYRMAHVHRTCLNRLGYNWRGQVNDHCAPQWDGKQFQWDEYDRHYGPLLDGSAFADLPRKGVPVDTFYLPLNENWPVDVNRGFKGGYWIEQAFGPDYRAGLVEAARQFAAHFAQKGWNDTLAEFFLNGKVDYKQGRGWSGCSAPWVFDEPVGTQDFWALRWYGAAFHEGVNKALALPPAPVLPPDAPRRPGPPPPRAPDMVFRCDISRPQWQRDILDGVLDVNVVGGAMRHYARMVIDRKTSNGEVTLNYGSTNAVDQPNTQPAAWCIDTWCLGADGVLPWQTIGNDKSWQQGDALSLFYPPAPGVSAGAPAGPLPSIRLKSYRRGEQDVEYLVLLAKTLKQPRWAVGQAALDALKLTARFEQKGGNDAGTVDYGAIDPQALWELRIRVGAMLDKAKPPPQRRLADLRPTARDVGKLPDLGYVTVAPQH